MKYSEIDILNFVDGCLNDAQTAEFLAELRVNPELANLVELMQASKLPIDKAYEQESQTPVPPALRNRVAALIVDNARANNAEKPQEQSGESALKQVEVPNANDTAVTRSSDGLAKLGWAVCLLAGVAIGVVMSPIYSQFKNAAVSDNTQTLAEISALQSHERFVARVADYQSLYVENTVSAVSDSRLQQAQLLLQSLSSRSAVQTGIPDFTAYGYEFARAQELGFEGEVLVQLVYRKPGAIPLAFCYMPKASHPNLAKQVSQHHQLQAVSWIEDSQQFVIVADESQAILRKMSDDSAVVF